jgi:hypothetical protein
MLDYINTAYKVLHLYGYYDGGENVTVIKEGIDYTYKIIEKIIPNNEK